MAESIQAVHVEFTSSTKEMQADMERGRRKAAEFAKSVKGSVGAAKETGKSVSSGMKAAAKSTEGLNAAITASSGLMRNFGASALGPMGELANNFTALASGAGAFGVGLVAMTTSALAAKEAVSLLRAESERNIEIISKQSKASEVLLDVRKKLAKLDMESRVSRTGESEEALRIRDEVARLEANLEGFEVMRDAAQKELETLDRALAAGRIFGGLARDISDVVRFTDLAGVRAELNKVEGAIARTQAEIEALERGRTRIQSEEADKRIEIERREGEERVQKFLDAMAKRIRAEAKAREDARKKAKEESQKALDLITDRPREYSDLAYAIEDLQGPGELAPQGIGDAFLADVEKLRKADEERTRIAESLRQSQFKMEDLLGLDPPEEKAKVEGFIGGFAERARAELLTIEELGGNVASSLAAGFGNAFSDFVMGTQSASEAMRQFALSFLSDITQMLAKQALLSFITGGIGIPLPGFASGGSFTVGGSGGTDSQVVAFKATPGERVSVSPPGKMAGSSSNVSVAVHNYAGAAVAVRKSPGAGGTEIDVLIERVVEKSMADGRVGRAMQREYGLRRRGRRG